MSVTNEEIARLQTGLVERFGPEVASLAGMVAFFYHATKNIRPYGEANLVLLTTVLRTHCESRGIDWGKMVAAVSAQEDAHKTLKYLMSIPD